MFLRKLIIWTIISALFCNGSIAQVVINEGSNRNYSSIADEDGDYPDWVELYNAGPDTVSLFNYSISDKSDNPAKWVFPNTKLSPGQFKTIFCSGKDRAPISGFLNVINTGTFTPVVGWNTHSFSTPFYWDGISNILVNTCSYNSNGYTSNSVFNQTSTPFLSTVFTFQDGSSASCFQSYGTAVYQRPNMKLNGFIIGTGTVQNSPTDYPAPYGNWYWSAKNQMLIRASELTDAGLTAGYISNIAFSVAGTDPNTVYDYIDISMKQVSANAVSSHFETVDPNNNLHTNFKISKSGETIYLYSPSQVLLSSLFVNCNSPNNSRGSFPDSSSDIFLFREATPSATNNQSNTYNGYLYPPVFSVQSGLYDAPFSVSIINPNGGSSIIKYTTDGSDPTSFSLTYNGTPVNIYYSTVLKAIAITAGVLPSPFKVSSYLLGVNHVTPILSLITDNVNLYGGTGIFDNWTFDWQKPAYVEYFDSTQQLVFSQNTGMQIDGGAGGSRQNPQHSFRLELDNSVLGDGPVNYKMIPNRPDRTKYSTFYLRNGSNQYLVFPHKDATQVTAMGGGTKNYYSAWRPTTVYINGSYFGLYELREKFDTEYFKTLEGANTDSIDILSQSYWYGGILRPVAGSVDSFWSSYAVFKELNTSDTDYWNLADKYFDMAWYTDYIIGESWMGNNDWPGNNIKIYRSDKTNYKWRFCLVDMELAMLPNGWTDCYFDHIQYMLSADPSNPYINIWLKGIQNERFRNYFINRYADIMNTSYNNNRISAVENNMFNQTVIEMQNEYARWGDPNNIPQQMNNFYNNHLLFASQLSERNTQVRNHIQSNFALPNQVDITLNVIPADGGKIQISTVTPDTYPWQGVYFNGLPVKIVALPNDGYKFLHWENNLVIDDTLNYTFNDTLNTSATNFTAYFADFTSVGSYNKSSGFALFPNPAKNNLYVINNNQVNSSNLSFQVCDLNGRIMKNGTLSGLNKESVIDVNSMPPSVYLLRIFDTDGTIEKFRFIKIQE
ncbi:MAG: CotH kinase family protein [Bacteroidota bacterium]